MESNSVDISGPLFLLIYAVFAVATIVVVRRMSRRPPPAFGPQPTPLVDVERDPFEVAYLRGGGGCLLRFAVYELVRRRALRIVMTGKKNNVEAIEATGFAEGDGPGTLLSAIVASAATPKTSREALAGGLLVTATADGKASFEPALVADGLLTSPDEMQRARGIVGIGALVLVAVAVARIVQALSVGHHNVGFLVVEAVFALLALVLLGRPRRVTARGRAYLASIRAALAPAPAQAPAGGTSIFEPQPILVAAAGFEFLLGTEYAPLAPFVRTTSADGSCSTSGGDSSGGDGGGGCGGGCGG